MAQKSRVLLVDDHPMVRDALRQLLEEEAWVEEVVPAGSVEEAVREATHRQVEVIVMDVTLPDGDGIDAIRTLVRRVPKVKVLVLTHYEDESQVQRAIRAGARGYARKNTETDDLVAIVRAVASGCFVLDPTIAVGFLADVRRAPVRLPAPFDQLTEREREILGALLRHDSSETIANHHGLQPKTVRNLLSVIYEKLRVAGKAEALRLAREHGVDKLL